jgi:hypothetical protein
MTFYSENAISTTRGRRKSATASPFRFVGVVSLSSFGFIIYIVVHASFDLIY